jgi:hypothetical protein
VSLYLFDRCGNVVYVVLSPVDGGLKGKEVVNRTGRRSLVLLTFVYSMANSCFSVVLEALDKTEPPVMRELSYIL